MSKPIIFLDIDGVLNTLDQCKYGPGTKAVHYVRFFDPAMVAHLNKVVDTTNADLVVSSSWRNLVHEGVMTVLGLSLLLRTHGVHGAVIDVTPPNPEDEPRRQQILAWLKANKDHGPWVVIDDDPGACVSEKRFIRTDPMAGLTEDQALLAIEALVGHGPLPAEG